MLIIRAERLDEADCRKGAFGEVREKRCLILKMCASSCRCRIKSTVRVEWSVFGVICEWLVVVLKERIRLAGQSVAPTARVPFPAHTSIVQAIPDRRRVFGPGGVNIVDG